MNGATPAVGSFVGSKRWPYVHAHPDCWGFPHRGTVLARNDVRAWTGTIAFAGIPSQDQVDAHIAWCEKKLNAGFTEIPVEWEFGRIYFQSPDTLQPYDADLSQWKSARKAAFASLRTEQPALV